MSFDLCNSPAVFQKFINATFQSLIDDETVLICMDDLIIPSKNHEDELSKLRRVLEIISDCGLNINWDKCQFLKSKLEFLEFT